MNLNINLDSIISSAIFILLFYVLFFIGKIVNRIMHRGYDPVHELFQQDNSALALAMTGYYAGLVIAIGGVISGPSSGLVDDVIDVCIYGLLAVVLLNVSWIICDRLILFRCNIKDELIRDQNQGAGVVSMAVSIASGFVIYGSVSGQGGSIWTAIAFWASGQVMLIIAALVYELITPYKMQDEIEKDNVAAGVSFAGALISIGIIVGLSAEGDFHSWQEDFPRYLFISVLGILMLPVVRFMTDWILLPGVTLEDEIAGQEKPNIGAAYLEAFSYIAAAFIINWCI